ncbi:MAG: methylmalonyl-CoA epimerase [Deltaproteobacteria bacterium RIFCSPLOWO2_02_FULL_50_16]|nr:MAG: methylmalonyl-CoA epimerase [Deltaproteobacteria bacterium GWA2_50_8]OGQ32504.1 MAG: methylmalonyl-CoA epimerase [Deltaproteobacteria bacterium RIFCSPHIGHO2_02_FULL_50_15]OGQ58548.1 MAG: methylmalonyl-CoA epimerase [Deltaproteobacteria bacterium RIFCSPLOWO2_02_FULL_50_16]OGQ67350.1 MAG: methylmalonyl-CoA epimerase [Deltaproteobacteria bacterium RIFCSPLOWO2_12_FULL_50_11]
MPFKYIHHIGIAVQDLETAIALYQRLLGKDPEHVEIVADQNVKTAFFSIGSTLLELISPTTPDSPIAKFIEKKGAGIHHICLEVNDIENYLEKLKREGVKLIDATPQLGAHGRKIAFIHPKSMGGVLIELSEKS